MASQKQHYTDLLFYFEQFCIPSNFMWKPGNQKTYQNAAQEPIVRQFLLVNLFRFLLKIGSNYKT